MQAAHVLVLLYTMDSLLRKHVFIIDFIHGLFRGKCCLAHQKEIGRSMILSDRKVIVMVEGSAGSVSCKVTSLSCEPAVASRTASSPK
jgi:hypothetical protein